LEKIYFDKTLDPKYSDDFCYAHENDFCPDCKDVKLVENKGIEIAHIFYLGKKYSDTLASLFVNENNDKIPFEMGCYGIGVIFFFF
jgi:prolyl-tRNA synthetase